MLSKVNSKNTDNFAQILNDFAIEIIRAIPDEINNVLENCLKSISGHLEADRVYIYIFVDEKTRLFLLHQYKKNGLKDKIPQHEQINSEDFALLIDPILRGTSFKFLSEKDRITTNGTIRAIMQAEGSAAFIHVPIPGQNDTIGLLGVDWSNNGRELSQEVESFLFNSARIFSSVIERQISGNTSIQLEKKYESIFTNSQDVVFITTPEGKLVEINPAGLQLFGYNSIDEMLQIDVGKDLFFNADDRERYKKHIETKGYVKDYELTLRDRRGQKIFVIVTANAVTNGKGEIIAYQGIMRNITYHRQLEQELFQAKKMESIGLLAGGVAHDFNNILTTISGYAELTKMEMDPANQHFENMENILKGVRRAEDLIHQLLAFSRKQMIKPVVVNINELIRDLHSMLARLISEDIRFDFALKSDVDCIKADPAQIQQILTNLVVNANQAIKEKKSKDSGNLIKITTDLMEIGEDFVKKHPGSRPGKYVAISVKDTGIGMNDETKRNIFEPFFSTKRDGKGTGLGLATVYGIVKQNEGYIDVESGPGQGTIFQILWPATEDKPVTDKDVESKVTFVPRNETILCVEDDYNVRELMCGALKSLGYTVIEAENGRVALEKVRKDFLWDKIDLVISDIIMPEMSGEDLAAELRKTSPEMKILLCSGFTDSRISLHDAYKEKGYHFLAKPYSLNKLEKTIRLILAED